MQALFIALHQILTTILRCKQHILQGGDTCFELTHQGMVVLGDIVVDVFGFAVECHARTEHKESLAATKRSTGEIIILEMIT